jgi:hypothetical protein
VIQEPALALDPDDAGRIYLIYRAPRIGSGFDSALDFARSTDGGGTWSDPLEIATAPLPREITSASLHAGGNGIVHVAWVETRIGSSSILYRRHLAGGDPGQAFEPALEIVDSSHEPRVVCLSGDEGANVLAVYATGDGVIRTAHSPDEGASFPEASVLLVGLLDWPDEFAAAGDGAYVYLVYRSGQTELWHLPVLAENPGAPSSPSIVTDDGEPARGLCITVWPGSGPAVAWLQREGDLGRPFLDAAWFGPTGMPAAEIAGGAPGLGVGVSPNPFRSETAIELDLALPVSTAHVAAYFASGRLARRLHAGPLPAGRNRLLWNGRNDRGVPLPAGVYYVAATLPGGTRLTRAVLVP